ncbi:MAG: family 4 glycosyl hydrolase [Planctomycetota bacterium]
MNIVFVGGGSLRILPILRGVFKHHKKVCEDGEIRLVDLDVEKAELVGKMIMKTPEYQNLSNCKVSWNNNLDEMLKGADLLYVTMAIGSRLNNLKAEQACRKLGFIGSDQISPQGAVLSLIGGKTVLNFARKMEQHCPKAKMLIFANPVAVYSGMVNNHTKIKALGICGGYSNHSYDLTRIIFGEDGRRDGYDVNVAGVNHCSFILNGTYNGEDLFTLMDNAVTENWQPPEVCSPFLKFVLQKVVDMYKKLGGLIFSTEGDGFTHLFYEETMQECSKIFSNTNHTEEEMQKIVDEEIKQSRAAYESYRKNINADLPKEFWNKSRQEDPYFAICEMDVTLPTLKALAGLGSEKIVASLPNRGAVKGFKDRTVLEYSVSLDENGAVPAADLEIPDTYHGLMSSLASHQTLLGDAVATSDPRKLAEAFYAYPIFQNSSASKQVFTELMDIYAGEYPDVFKKCKKYL